MSDQSTVLQEDHLQERQFTLLRQKREVKRNFHLLFLLFDVILFYYESISSTFLAHFLYPTL